MLPIRECVSQTPGYVPGEQPQTTDYIKLNTNENPYPPPDKIFEGLQQELTKVRLYPDPVSTQLRKAAANVFGISYQNILAGNGSDDILNIAVRTFVNPGEVVAFLDLTYSLYETIARVHGASIVQIPTNNQFELNGPIICPEAKLIFVASPNPPVGKHLNRDYLEETCKQATGVVLIDEAYVDFSDENHLDFLEKYDNVIISRTMSKSYSLAGMRVGFGVSSTEIIEQMDKVRDSYNLDRIAQTLGTAVLNYQDYFKGVWQQVRHTRTRLIESLRTLEFLVFDSDSNFVLASPQWIAASDLYTQLKERKVLVRYFSHPRIKDYVRISIGTDQEIDRLLEAIHEIKGSN
ncbi:histidinol-phosphate aminotransferase [Rippkaea orientalis PCC 8801]|uniref:Histidinol-phosphate aminotransferase n=1 Tax=Rippkaea orientalis (strain PCC 8801 / RF-1) TaxID=41431 RepID=HIS8_RIPO1|nr:histidinol-phosphate transaminase [Rippkaea orientalis]B7JUI4.1 RecName: Full=Histidinol-phosphate aminotransferase; AltName: Full=Imidazole acetol-phosphate transaminase [Rippkaea orientalis PCC 8801]ACK65528.1 histidinol-phosphate aminotransferase [Rippkaea orientalis PCC 8801]